MGNGKISPIFWVAVGAAALAGAAAVTVGILCKIRPRYW